MPITFCLFTLPFQQQTAYCSWYPCAKQGRAPPCRIHWWWEPGPQNTRLNFLKNLHSKMKIQGGGGGHLDQWYNPCFNFVWTRSLLVSFSQTLFLLSVIKINCYNKGWMAKFFVGSYLSEACIQGRGFLRISHHFSCRTEPQLEALF